MRRKAALLVLFVFVAPVAARVAAGFRDPEAMRCALACARAGMGAEKGAACCPAGHGAAVPSLSSCAHEGEAANVPGAALPMLLAAAILLTLPSMWGGGDLLPDVVPPSPPSRVPDKVPLLLG